MTHIADAMAEALDDEYKAIATYETVLAAFGAVRPFVNIVEAERRHAAALLHLYEQRGLTPPPDRWHGRVPAPATLKDACAAGVAAEVENAALYDRLLNAVADDAAVSRVFTNLRDASQQRHLPAFRRCLERGGVAGDGAKQPGRRRNRHRHHQGSGLRSIMMLLLINRAGRFVTTRRCP